MYREDLKQHPRNGWALHGLAESLERQGRAAEAAVARGGFEEAWADATVTIQASCFCRENPE